MHGIEKPGLYSFSNRTPCATADLAIVQFANRRNFCGGTGEEGFVANIDLIPGDPFFNQFQAFISDDFHYGVAGNAVEG